MDAEGSPACWSWPQWGQERRAIYTRWGADGDWYLLLDWHEGRCALCGRAPAGTRADPLYQDHDYGSGMVRGWLCPSCNTLEGLQPGERASRVIVTYRLRPPSAILGISAQYVDIFGKTPLTLPRPTQADLERAIESLPVDE